MIYTDVWPFGLLLAHRLILVAQANLRIKKACINSQCFDFYVKRDVHVRLQRFTEKKLFSLLKKGNSWNKALCIIIRSLIYSDIAFKMHGVKSVYWLKEHQGYQNDSIPRALYFRSFSSKYSWKKNTFSLMAGAKSCRRGFKCISNKTQLTRKHIALKKLRHVSLRITLNHWDKEPKIWCSCSTQGDKVSAVIRSTLSN